jgi:hypothetical protein
MEETQNQNNLNRQKSPLNNNNLLHEESDNDEEREK